MFRNVFGAVCLSLAMSSAALAQESKVQSDLNKDGKAETFTLVRSETGVDLHITGTGGAPIIARNIVFAGPMFGQEPGLELAPNGSVRVTAMNEAIGRNRWELVLTLAFRSGEYRVAGVTWSERDTLDLDAWMSCDVNLLTGKGELEDKRGKRKVQGKADARAVTAWTEDEEMPPAMCR